MSKQTQELDYVPFPNQITEFLELIRWGENEIMKTMGIPEESRNKKDTPHQTQSWDCIFRDAPPGGEKIRIYHSPDGNTLEIQGNRNKIWSFEGWSAWIVQIRNIRTEAPTIIKAKKGHLWGVYEAIEENADAIREQIIDGERFIDREDLIVSAIMGYCKAGLYLWKKSNDASNDP